MMTRVPSLSLVQALTSNSWGKFVLFDDQGVVTGRGHRRCQSRKDSFPVVLHFASLAMHELLGTHDFASESLADGLVPEADSKHGHLSREVADHVDADASLLWRARAGRDYELSRTHVFDFLEGNLVIPAHSTSSPSSPMYCTRL